MNAIAQETGLVGTNLNEHVKDAMQHYTTPHQGLRSNENGLFFNGRPERH
jgi:hypothetical protein